MARRDIRHYLATNRQPILPPRRVLLFQTASRFIAVGNPASVAYSPDTGRVTPALTQLAAKPEAGVGDPGPGVTSGGGGNPSPRFHDAGIIVSPAPVSPGANIRIRPFTRAEEADTGVGNGGGGGNGCCPCV